MTAPGTGTATDPETWLDRHGDALYRLALLRVGDPDIASELVQETFLAALRGRATFSGRSTERTWLVGILKHKVLDRRRKFGRAPQVLEGPAVEDALAGPFDARKHWKKFPGRWPNDPSRTLEDQEFWAVLSGCLDGLPRPLAEAFVLTEIDDSDRRAVCDDLEITPANLSARLHRARMLLRGCLESRWFRAGEEPSPS